MNIFVSLRNKIVVWLHGELIGHKKLYERCPGPASVAQLDACPTEDQEVVGSTPAEVGNILSWRLIMKYFLVILSLRLIQEGQLSVSGERMCTILVNRLKDLASPVNVWLGKLPTLDMDPLG